MNLFFTLQMAPLTFLLQDCATHLADKNGRKNPQLEWPYACDFIPDDRLLPTALDPFTCNRYEMARFATTAEAIGVRYIGGCCGTGPHHIRQMAEALGTYPPASRYSPDMSKHSIFGSNVRH